MCLSAPVSTDDNGCLSTRRQPHAGHVLQSHPQQSDGRKAAVRDRKMGVGGPVFEYSGGSLRSDREQSCGRHQVQSMQILPHCGRVYPKIVNVGRCSVPKQCRAQRQRLGPASQHKRPRMLTLKAVCLRIRYGALRKQPLCPQPVSYSMLPQGSDSVGESSHSNSNAGGTPLMQKVASENWFQCRNVAISLDESLCQGGHHDANSQPRERPRI